MGHTFFPKHMIYSSQMQISPSLLSSYGLSVALSSFISLENQKVITKAEC